MADEFYDRFFGPAPPDPHDLSALMRASVRDEMNQSQVASVLRSMGGGQAVSLEDHAALARAPKLSSQDDGLRPGAGSGPIAWRGEFDT